ncbi:MAG TPA: lysophospholipid acyltransferase family protein [Acidobacteriota bacterium]|jgi:1-acyl-sn-glycerol-3-phosphate acyltransferase
MIRTLAIMLLISVVLILAGPVLLLYTAITSNPHPMYVVARWTIRAAFRIAGIRIRIRGDTENLASRNFIFMANHVSNVDPPVCFACIPHDIKVIFKKELLRLPILSTAMRLARCVPVDRGDTEAGRGAIDRAIEQATSGDSFLLYPEGTRSRDGTLGAFKGGGFILSIKSGVPIVPITLVGTREIQPKGNWKLNRGQVEVMFHPPLVPPSSTDDKDLYRDKVRCAVDSGLKRGWSLDIF